MSEDTKPENTDSAASEAETPAAEQPDESAQTTEETSEGSEPKGAWAGIPEGRPIEPYETADKVKQEARRFVHPTTRMEDRVFIYRRLQKTGADAAPAVPIMMETLSRQDVETRHKLLDLFLEIQQDGAELSAIADELAKNLNDSNHQLRDRVCTILVEMGPAAESAATRALGCTRHANEEVRMAAVRVLDAIGPACAQQALPRLEAMLREPRTTEANRKDIKRAMTRLSVEPGGGEASSRLNELRHKGVDFSQAGEEIEKPFSGLHILVVEDTTPMRKVVVKVLSKNGAEVSEATDGMNALEVINKIGGEGKNVDLILLDLMMPRLNGLQCLQKIRQLPAWKDVPVICMSAVKEKKAVAAAVNLGIIDYILKPFQVEKVLATVQKNIDNGKVGGKSSAPKEEADQDASEDSTETPPDTNADTDGEESPDETPDQ